MNATPKNTGLAPVEDLAGSAEVAASADTGSARDRILRAAHDLFYGEGIRATGIDRVIAESGVTKVTFYRHFPSKNDLVLAYLDLRHARWLAWFEAALARHGGADRGAATLAPALGEWFRGEALGDFRGCAFLNGVGEIGGALPEVVEVTRRHKADMADAIAAVLPPSRQRKKSAAALSLAIDGAIVQAQYADDPGAVLKRFQAVVDGVVAAAGA